jgi:maltooligosyltrehalose trehalohydrolase
VPELPWQLRYGARVLAGGGVEFRVWAPQLEAVSVVLDLPGRLRVPMRAGADGEFAAVVPEAAEGVDYWFATSNGTLRPDPVSRWQPYGVHGASRVVDPRSFRWTDAGWKGMELKDYVIYELHTGTFTAEGTFGAIIPRLPYLRDLGVTAIELMPVAEFPGSRNWGYDGVALFAPHSAYGGPDGLKALVDACHREGLAVILDVVYNHLGPEGNYLAEFGPYFTDRYRTPWGPAINFDGPGSDGVRRFFIDNALYWLTEFHIDALRLDAIHGIYDFSARHVLEELAASFRHQAEHLGRKAFLIAESDLNDVRVIRPPAQGGYGLDAQWLDDFHHAVRGILTGERRGYLADFGRVADLAKALEEGFVYDGRYSAYRRRRHGSSSREIAGDRFVAFIQNHDQIANASLGRRLCELVSRDAEMLAAVLLVCSPFVPLLFMGQEYGETAPFLYFTSHGDAALIDAVRKGRRDEYAAFYREAEFPEPQDPLTFARSKIRWERASEPAGAAMLDFYRRLLWLRRRYACLSNCRKDLVRVAYEEEERWLVLERGDPSGERAVLLCNLRPESSQIPFPLEAVRPALLLWTGAVEPPQRPDGNVLLGGWGSALYLAASPSGLPRRQGKGLSPALDSRARLD